MKGFIESAPEAKFREDISGKTREQLIDIAVELHGQWRTEWIAARNMNELEGLRDEVARYRRGILITKEDILAALGKAYQSKL
jgi:ferric-dicitrate binding protein FerR (iron transport regulator)